jgi:hypothetical protein
MLKDYTKYNELLREARTKNDEASRTVAKQYVPKLYAELINLGYEPYLARVKVLKDCRSMWVEDTIDNEISDEAKDAKKAKNGRKSAEARKQKRITEKKHQILLKQGAVIEISNASMGSADGSVWEYTNANGDFVSAEPVTLKPVTTEPLAVKTSSAPIHST